MRALTLSELTTRTFYVIQGLYGPLSPGPRVWKDWLRDEMTLKQARASQKNYDRGINPLTKERTAPSASRIVKRTVTEEVVDFNGKNP